MSEVTHTRDWQVSTLLVSARAATPFCADSGQVFASIPLGLEGHQVVQLQSKVFRNWLLARFKAEHEIIPRSSAVQDVIQCLEAQAQFGETGAPQSDSVTARPVVARRIASAPGKIVLDLHNDLGEAVEITADGWRVTKNLGAFFRAAKSASPLPHPEHSPGEDATGIASTFDRFEELLGLVPEHFRSCLSWLLGAMSPIGPYPILHLQGPSTSAKSTVARMLRALLDPGPAPFCSLPASMRDLQSVASNNWIVALDYIELLPAFVLRALVKVSTGMVFSVREGATDSEPFQIHVERPMIFTSEGALASDPGLNTRAITIRLPAASVPPSFTGFEQLRPRVLGALCSMVSFTLAGNHAGHTAAPPWATLTASPEPVATAVAALMQSQTEWAGTAALLLARLRAIDATVSWPETPTGITQLLRRTALNGIDFQSLQNVDGTRSIRLQKIDALPKTSADAQKPAASPPPARRRARKPSVSRAKHSS